MGKAQTNEKHPKGFYACCITFMFERLAFYGAKPILLLFLITATLQGGLGIERTDAAVMAANLTAYTYMAPLIGGIISDRWLGARYAISLGYIIMAIGYLVGWKATGPGMVNLMIILVSIGTGLFKGNLNALIGRQYQNKELLDAAFSIQYSYVNVGAFVGSLLTGFLYLHLFKKGDVLGFRQCFFVASIWCIVGLVWFVLNWKNLQGQGVKPFKYLTDENGNVIETKNPVLLRKTVSTETSELVKTYLQAVMQYGTGKRAQVEGYDIGAKTGTAQKLPRKDGKYLLSYIGYAPQENPEVVIYVVIDEANVDAQDNSSLVLELAKNIMSEAFPYLGITTIEETGESQTQQSGQSFEDTEYSDYDQDYTDDYSNEDGSYVDENYKPDLDSWATSSNTD